LRDGDVSGASADEHELSGGEMAAVPRWRLIGRGIGPLVRRPAARRSAWVVVDQGVSSITNVAAAVLVARAVSADSFGAFSIALLVYMVVVSVARALVSQPLAIRVSARSEQHGEVAAAAGAAIVVGSVAGAATVCGGVVIGGVVGAPLVVTGVLLPTLVLQDTWRFALFTMGRPARAVVNDLVWAGALVLLIVLVLTMADGSVVLLTGAWAGSAAFAAVVGVIQTRAIPAPGGSLSYLRRHLALGWRFTGEALLSTGGMNVTMLVIGPIAGAASVGAIRGGAALFGPFTVVTLAVGTGGIAEGSRLLARAPHRVLPVLLALSGSVVAIAVIWGATLLALPDDWGRAVLGDTWPGARELVLPFTVGCAAGGVGIGALLGLRVVAAASAILRLAAVSACVSFAAGVAGAVLWGAPGGVWGLALGGSIHGIGSWALLRRFQRHHPAAFSHATNGMDTDATRAIADGRMVAVDTDRLPMAPPH
jgi:hypothetical protein